MKKARNDIKNFVNVLQLAWQTDFNARIAYNEEHNTFIVELNVIRHDVMEACVSYSARFEKRYKSAVLFVDAQDKNFPDFDWEKLE